MAPLVVDGFVPGVLSDSEVVFSDDEWQSEVVGVRSRAGLYR